MEQRLKKQRNRLFRRVTLILAAVWLVVSLMYCVIRLYNEKITSANREHENLSYTCFQLSVNTVEADSINRILINETDLLYTDSSKKNIESQIIVVDMRDNTVVSDTAGKIGVRFGAKLTTDSSTELYGFLFHDTIYHSLSDSQMQTVSRYLNTERDDGKHYELICSQFYCVDMEFVPIELKIALVNDDSDWFISDEIVETISLSGNKHPDEEVYVCNDMQRNSIPREFLFNSVYNQNLIGSLTEEQRSSSQETIATGPFDFIFYGTDSVHFKEDVRESTDTESAINNNTTYLVQYAVRIHLLDNCGGDLILGVSVSFVFFFIIALILCLMIWKVVETQILQEQKRADITNALAHDIKTPLFVISGYAYSLKEDIDADERDRYLDKIIEQSDAINHLVHKMLNLSKLDSYTMTLNRTEWDLCGLVQEILEDFTVLPDGKQITLTQSGSHTVCADRELLTTALQNLVDNAVKYSTAGGTIAVDVTGTTLRIQNPSEPMSKAELKQIWQPYVRRDKSRRQNGNGLGLSIVKSILDLHGVAFDVRMQDENFVFTADFGS